MSQSEETDAEILAEARAEASVTSSRASVGDAVEADQDLARAGAPPEPGHRKARCGASGTS